MKTIATAVALSTLIGSHASAATLVCASNKDEKLYYSIGQLTLSAGVVNETKLRNVDMALRPELKHGSQDSEATGAGNGEWIRFPLQGDAWCSYKLILPAEFEDRADAFPAIVDAACEAGTKSSIRMNCRLR